METPSGALPHIPPGKEAAYYAVVRTLTRFLEKRGEAGWAFAGADDIRGLDAAAIQEWFAAAPEPRTLTGLDLLSGEEGAPIAEFRPRERDAQPRLALWLAPGAAVLRFCLFDDGYFGDYTLVAAADAAQLAALLRGLDDARLALMRDSDDYQVLGRQKIAINRNLGWDDVLLPEGVKSDIRGNVEAFVRGREAYGRLGLSWKRGFLFVGPPGNGKTTLCKVIAAQAGLPCLYMLMSGDAGRDPIGEIFTRARQLAPCILIFEDLDALVAQEERMAYFLNQLDGVQDNHGLLTLATTNHPEQIDPALINRPSRFDRVWAIGNPDALGRLTYLRRLFGSRLEEGELTRLARETDGFPVTYIKELFVSAAQEALLAGGEVRFEHAERCLSQLRAQLDSAGRKHVEWIPMGFGRADDD